jgi:hypothetical protein
MIDDDTQQDARPRPRPLLYDDAQLLAAYEVLANQGNAVAAFRVAQLRRRLQQSARDRF